LSTQSRQRCETHLEDHQTEHFENAARRALTARRADDLDYFVRKGALLRGFREFEYRDHRFEVRPFGLGWRVFIYTPGSGILFRDVPRSLKPDSRDAVIQEAREVVDQRIRENRLALSHDQVRTKKSKGPIRRYRPVLPVLSIPVFVPTAVGGIKMKLGSNRWRLR